MSNLKSSQSPRSYQAYGLKIWSEFLLPELLEWEDRELETEVEVLADPPRPMPPRAEEQDPTFDREGDEVRVCWNEIGEFRIVAGRSIHVRPLPEIESRLVRLPLLGPVFAILLHQRGKLVLHGSAVTCGGGAIAFLGAKGRGKSTLAAALYARGHRLVSDDVLVVASGPDGAVMLKPGFPQLKLWPDVVASCLGTDPRMLRPLAPGGVKVAYPARARFAGRPVPLLGIFVVDDGDQSRIAPLSPREGLLELVRHSHGSRFGRGLLQGKEAAGHLRRCVSLANAVPVQRLMRPPCLESLPILARVVEEAAAGLEDGVSGLGPRASSGDSSVPEPRDPRPDPPVLAMAG